MVIYKIINKVNNKFYIGKSVNSAQIRFSQHIHAAIKSKKSNNRFYNAIRKYGKDNFYFEILEQNIPSELLNDKEKLWISKLNPHYNSTIGGEGTSGFKFSNEQKLKMSLNRKGKKHTDETIEKLRLANLGEKNPMYGKIGKNNPFYGKKHNLEFIERKSKCYTFLDPNNQKITIKNLSKYCRDNNLHCGNMNSLYYGKIKSYKGYKSCI